MTLNQPADLDATASALWAELRAELEKEGRWDEKTSVLLADVCRHGQRAREAQGANDPRKENAAEKAYAAGLHRLGFSPAARAARARRGR